MIRAARGYVGEPDEIIAMLPRARARGPARDRDPAADPLRARVFRDFAEQVIAATSMGNVAAAVIELLEALGVRRAYGLTGGPIAPFCDQLGRSGIEAMHCRHESGAAFAALEDSLASGLPPAVFVTTGPGVTNALTGMCAARWEGGRVLLISACTPAREMGRRAFQETSDATLPPPACSSAGRSSTTPGGSATPPSSRRCAAAIARGLARPQGWVGHLSLPLAVQTQPCPPLDLPPVRARRGPEPAPRRRLRRAAARARLRDLGRLRRARAPRAEIAAVAERTGAAVMCSPRGRGVFPRTTRSSSA